MGLALLLAILPSSQPGKPPTTNGRQLPSRVMVN